MSLAKEFYAVPTKSFCIGELALSQVLIECPLPNCGNGFTLLEKNEPLRASANYSVSMCPKCRSNIYFMLTPCKELIYNIRPFDSEKPTKCGKQCCLLYQACANCQQKLRPLSKLNRREANHFQYTDKCLRCQERVFFFTCICPSKPFIVQFKVPFYFGQVICCPDATCTLKKFQLVICPSPKCHEINLITKKFKFGALIKCAEPTCGSDFCQISCPHCYDSLFFDQPIQQG